MSNTLKKFVGDYAYSVIKNITVDTEALKRALVTPQNARNVFSDMDEFQIKSICHDICNSGEIGTIKKTTKEEIISAFNEVGYDTVIFDDYDAIAECKKYYEFNETICTYKNLQGRMNEYYMIVAIKKDIDNIQREKHPTRDGAYGTSILNIQIAKNGSHMSIKNRYNHTVQQCDSTLDNNLNKLYMGLQSMVLGYYGFASLVKHTNNYNNIVKIGNVYLKYWAEKDNIYYGTFVLSNTSGIQYVDTSRYYISHSIVPIDFSIIPTPNIVDFQKKEAFVLTQKRGEDCNYIIKSYSQNSKSSLITRALKEGILSSANKKTINILQAIFPNAKKELLQSNPKALQYLHTCYGYDFTKPFEVTGILGNFTAKKLEKITDKSSGHLFITFGTDLKIVEFNNGKFNAKNLKSGYKWGINTFYTQGDFEAWRKELSVAAFFVYQDSQYKLPIKSEPCRSYSYRNEEFDKSGCNLTQIRHALNWRLEKYKANKKAKEAKATDFSKDITEIQELFQSFQNKAANLLANGTTEKDFVILENVTGYKLTWLIRNMYNLLEAFNNQTFTSVEVAYDKINDVKGRFIKRIMTLDEYERDKFTKEV